MPWPSVYIPWLAPELSEFIVHDFTCRLWAEYPCTSLLEPNIFGNGYIWLVNSSRIKAAPIEAVTYEQDPFMEISFTLSCAFLPLAVEG